MSLFLPEGSNTPSLQSPGVAQPTDPEVTDADLKLMQRVLGAAAQYPNMMPDAFTAYIFDYIQSQRLQVPIGQVFGFSQFTAQPAANVTTAEATSSTAFGDLATVGPTLTGLPDGKYIILFGGAASVGAGISALMSVSVNGVAIADDRDAAITTAGATNQSTMSWVTATMANGGSNTVKAQYRVNGASTATFFNRRLLALKYGNP